MKRSGPLRRTPFASPVTEDGEPFRYSSLARHEGLARTGIRPVRLAVVESGGAAVLAPEQWQQRRTPETGFPRSVKLAVRKRAGDGDPDEARCEACGRWLGHRGGEVQHRAARGSGGCTDEVINGITNAVLLCGHGAAPIRSGCHGKCEDRDEHMAMDAGGFWIRHGTTPEYDPRNVRVMLHGAGGGGITVWLLEDGTYGYASPDGAA